MLKFILARLFFIFISATLKTAKPKLINNSKQFILIKRHYCEKEVASLLCGIVLTGVFFQVYAQSRTDMVLSTILQQNNNALLHYVIKEKDSFRLQIIYTRIDRDKNNTPSFKNYYFNTDTNLYFNPASTVKLPLALLSLEKLHQMNIKDVNKYTTLQIDSSYERQTKVQWDSSAQNNLPSIAQYIRKAFLVSDNDAYNRLYEFTGQQRINTVLQKKGYAPVRITRQFLGFSEEQNRHTNPFRFLDTNGSLLYYQPPAYNPDPIYFGKIVKIGKAYYNNLDSLINAPIDFTKANNLPLESLQQMLQSVLFPSSVPAYKRFNLKEDDYTFLYQYLSQFPGETNYPKYDSSQYYNNYVKFYFRNDAHQLPEGVRVFNKVGWAYGFLTDVSYVVDFKNKVEFMLASTIYVNSDEILNDDKYDYKTIGWPFLYQLGQTLYQHELHRKRKYSPDLKRYKLTYETRDSKDSRPTIKNVDN